jgi:SAM-dependent methyltransferase
MDAGGTATTECPPNRGSEWKHESPDFSRGENQALVRAEHAFLPIEGFETFKAYLSGDGLEIGGPSPVFSGRSILPVYRVARSLDNCNFASTTVFQGRIGGEGRTFRYAKNRLGLQFICEATDLSRIATEKYDFIVSSHTIEHIANPLRALLEWKRVLKRGGVLLLVCPNKERTFDHNRAVTRVDHLIEDYERNVDESDLTHLPEILRLHDMSMDPMERNLRDFVARSRNNVRNRTLHHHVFDTDLVVQMVSIAGFKTLFIGTHRFHIIVLCQKRNEGTRVGERGGS